MIIITNMSSHQMKMPIACEVKKLINAVADAEIVLHALDADAIKAGGATVTITEYLYTLSAATVLTMELAFEYVNPSADIRLQLYVDPVAGPAGAAIVDSTALAPASGVFTGSGVTASLAAGTYRIYVTMKGGAVAPNNAVASTVTIKQKGTLT